MTTETTYSLAQLAQILSALDNERRNPNTKRNAIKAIARAAAEIGLTAEDIFAAADGLLSGRMDAAEFRAQLRDEPSDPGSSPRVIRGSGPAAEPVTNEAAAEPVEVYLMPNAGPLAVSTETADVLDDIPPFLRREPPDEPPPPEPERRWVMPSREAKAREPRQGTKQARMIEMLKRPEGATVEQIMHETGWLAHTVRGVMAGALKKKLGLTITSEKGDGGSRTYRIA